MFEPGLREQLVLKTMTRMDLVASSLGSPYSDWINIYTNPNRCKQNAHSGSYVLFEMYVSV